MLEFKECKFNTTYFIFEKGNKFFFIPKCIFEMQNFFSLVIQYTPKFLLKITNTPCFFNMFDNLKCPEERIFFLVFLKTQEPHVHKRKI